MCFPKVCRNSLLLALDLPAGELWECVVHAGTEGRGAEWALGQSARREIGSSVPLTAHFAQWTKNRTTEPQAPSSVLCHANSTFLFPLDQTFLLGVSIPGLHLLWWLANTSACKRCLVSHWKDKLLILFSVILSQRAKAHLTGLT